MGRERSTRNLNSTSSDALSKDSSGTTSEEEKEMNEPEYNNPEENPVSYLVSQSESVAGVLDQSTVSQQLSQVTAADQLADKPDIGELQIEVSAGAEDGWQPAQRPKAYGTAAQRLRHRRTNIGKIYGYQEKDVSTEVSQYNSRDSYKNNRYYFLKKRTASSDVIMAPIVEISTECNSDCCSEFKSNVVFTI